VLQAGRKIKCVPPAKLFPRPANDNHSRIESGPSSELTYSADGLALAVVTVILITSFLGAYVV
jgi:hypothetical protein